MGENQNPTPFADVNQRYLVLKQAFQQGEISQEAYYRELEKLVVTDKSGRTWRLAADGRWAYYDGQIWVAAEPPQPAVSPGSAAPPGKQRKLGWLIAGVAIVGVLCVCLVALVGTGTWSFFNFGADVSREDPAEVMAGEETQPPIIPPELDLVIEIPTPTETPEPTPPPIVVFSEDQQEVYGTFGWPDSFVIYEVDVLEGDPVRFEAWNYYPAMISFMFVDGVFSGDDVVKPLPAGFFTTPYQPDQFPLGASLELVLENLAGYELFPIDGSAAIQEGLQLYGGQQLVVGFLDNRLFYVDAMAFVVEGGD